MLAFFWRLLEESRTCCRAYLASGTLLKQAVSQPTAGCGHVAAERIGNERLLDDHFTIQDQAFECRLKELAERTAQKNEFNFGYYETRTCRNL